jgi:hypothetical protein
VKLKRRGIWRKGGKKDFSCHKKKIDRNKNITGIYERDN